MTVIELKVFLILASLITHQTITFLGHVTVEMPCLVLTWIFTLSADELNQAE